MNSFENYYEAYNDNSYIRQLVPDPETEKNYPNARARPVKSGHYVLATTTPISDPYMISYSDALMKELNLTKEIMESNEMLKYLSGYLTNLPQWVTGYALSIYGQPMITNCPSRNNSQYGDGRAHSIGEFVVDDKRWEFQLKGSGTTPFSRSGDGRAVLRSSVREYLVSEAMFNLHVPTTRALSLIVSMSEKVERSWYILNNQSDDQSEISDDQPKCNLTTRFETLQKKQTCSIGRSCDYNNVIEQNPVAIVCRIAPSFIRVGHLELFGIRAKEDNSRLIELELLFKHMVFREYPQFLNMTLEDAVLAVADEFAIKLSILISDWMRVGYVQSNFNSDNCLVSGRTMDYGPFGFVEKYDPDKQFWTGGGFHFSFMNQMNAAKKNFISFVNSLKPLLQNQADCNKLDESIKNFDDISQKIMNNMWTRKLGLLTSNWQNEVGPLLKRLHVLMKFTDFDYTIFWRQLSNCPLFNDEQKIFTCMSKAFYDKQFSDDWKKWFVDYSMLLKKDYRDPDTISILMKFDNPKYIPREWMLVKAYTDAQNNSFDMIHKLQKLFKNPYDEQPDMEDMYYKLTPLEIVEDKPGYSIMSCSS